MGIQQTYTDWSATYDTDRNLTRDLDRTVTRQLLGQCCFGCILEIGCGTGKNTPFYAEIGDSVHALDFSEGMLDQARTKATAPNVRFTYADLNGQWPSPDHFFDLVVCNLVLEHIAEIGFIFAEAARVLTDGGHFFVCELHPFRQYLGSQANFVRGEEQTAIPAFVHHISNYTQAAAANGFALERLGEWWHPEDSHKPPRLVSFLFQK